MSHLKNSPPSMIALRCMKRSVKNNWENLNGAQKCRGAVYSIGSETGIRLGLGRMVKSC
jgi:hypothetical protein